MYTHAHAHTRLDDTCEVLSFKENAIVQRTWYSNPLQPPPVYLRTADFHVITGKTLDYSLEASVKSCGVHKTCGISDG